MLTLLVWFAQLPPISRIVVFFGIWVGLWLPIAVPLSNFLHWQPFRSASPAQKLPLVLSLYALAPLVLWGVAQAKAIAEPQAVAVFEYGLSGQMLDLTIGLGLGVIGVGALVGLECWLGWAIWHRSASLAVLVPMLALALAVSAVEEPVFRGFLLDQLQAIFPTWLAIGSSSLLFALLHLIWDGRATLPQLPGLWLMGMVLGLARWADGGALGLAIGLHAGWIWAMATLDAVPLIQRQSTSPTWITGVNGQPLAGAIGLLLLLLTGGSVWLFGHWR